MKQVNKTYKERIAESAKVAISELLVKLSEKLDSELEDNKLKLVLTGRLEIIKSIREMLIRLSEDSKQEEWIKSTLTEFKEGVENTFDVLETLTKKTVKEEDQSKYGAIAKSKNEANKFMEDIMITIQELEENIEKGDTELSKTVFTSSIESFAIE